MIDVHVMKTIPPYHTFRIDLGFSPMRLCCPIAGSNPLVRTNVRMTRP